MEPSGWVEFVGGGAPECRVSLSEEWEVHEVGVAGHVEWSARARTEGWVWRWQGTSGRAGCADVDGDWGEETKGLIDHSAH